MTRDHAAAYLSGLIDADGSVYHDLRRRCVVFYNSEAALIEAACEAFDALGVTYSVNWRDSRPSPTRTLRYGTVSAHGRENLETLAQVLTLRSAKAGRLRAAVASYRLRAPLRQIVRLHDEGLTTRQIAEAVGYKSKSSVAYHLRKAGR